MWAGKSESTQSSEFLPRGKPHTEDEKKFQQLLNGSSSLCKCMLPGTALKTPRSLLLRKQLPSQYKHENNDYAVAILSGDVQHLSNRAARCRHLVVIRQLGERKRSFQFHTLPLCYNASCSSTHSVKSLGIISTSF